MPATHLTSPRLADCDVCHGTGIDEAFSSVCLCRPAGPSARSLALRAQLGDDARGPRTPNTTRPAGTGRANPARHANQFPGRCTRCGTQVAAGAGYRVRDGQGWAVRHNLNECPTPQAPAQAAVTPAAVAAPPARTNRFAAPCARCRTQIAAGAGSLAKVGDEWVVSHIGSCPKVEVPAQVGTGIDLHALQTTHDATWYGVPGADTRLKVRVRKVTEGRWAGYIFVDDGAVYGQGRRYGKQAPGQSYVGDIADELRLILADQVAALAKYGHLTSRCGVCQRPLEDEQSVARGIGPVCFGRLG